MFKQRPSKTRPWIGMLGAVIALGVSALHGEARAEDTVVAPRVEDMTALQSAYALIEERSYIEAQDAYRALLRDETAPASVREAAALGEAFVLYAQLRERLDATKQGGSGSDRMARFERNRVLNMIKDKTAQTQETQLMGFLKLMAAEEGNITPASFGDHPFGTVLQRVHVYDGPAFEDFESQGSAVDDLLRTVAQPDGKVVSLRVVTSSNVRAAPRIASDIVGYLNAGEIVDAYEARITPPYDDNEEWYALADREGFVHASLLAPATADAPGPGALEDPAPPRRERAQTPAAASPTPSSVGSSPITCGGSPVAVYRAIETISIFDRPGGVVVGSYRPSQIIYVMAVRGDFLVLRQNNACRVARFRSGGRDLAIRAN